MLRESDEFNHEKVGVLGASLGGLLSVFAMSVLPEVSAGYFAVAGGDFPSILANSNQDVAKRLRSYRMSKFGMTSPEEYEDYLRRNLRYDPLDFASEIPTDAVRMVISNKDRKVPTENQWLLHEALGRPLSKVYRWGHIWTIFFSLGNKDNQDEITDFFVERFSQDNPRVLN